MKGQNQTDMGLIFAGQVYFIAKHYSIRIGDVWNMSEDEFRESIVWATAAERLKTEEIEKAPKEAKSGTHVANTDPKAQAFPFSDNRW